MRMVVEIYRRARIFLSGLCGWRLWCGSLKRWLLILFINVLFGLFESSDCFGVASTVLGFTPSEALLERERRRRWDVGQAVEGEI